MKSEKKILPKNKESNNANLTTITLNLKISNKEFYVIPSEQNSKHSY